MKKLFVAIIVVLLLTLLATALVFYARPLAVLSYMNRRALTRVGFAKKVVPTPFGPQTTFQAGSGPTLVFLHGAGDNAGAWAKVAADFTVRYRVVLVDLPGHGESSPATGPLPMATMVRDLGAVLDSVCPCTVVGNSLGAWLGMIEAVNKPEKFTRLVLVDGGPLRGDRPDMAKLPTTRAEGRRMFEAVLDSGTARAPDFVVDDFVRQAQRGPMGRMAAAGDMERFVFREEMLRNFRVPVDLLWGESDRLIPLDYARRMQALLPAVRLTTLPRCGHLPQAECPVAFGKALDKILRQDPPPAATQPDRS